MDLPIFIDVHPSSPPSRLQSPEPSGTPDLRRVAAQRDMATFSYGHVHLSRNSNDASVDYNHQQLDYIEASPFLSSNGIAAQKLMQDVNYSICSLSDEENRGVDPRAISQAGSYLERVNSKPENVREMSKSTNGSTWKVKPTTISSIECLEGQHQVFKKDLRSCSQEVQLVGGMHPKFLDLVQKVGASDWNPDLKTSNSVSIPVKNRKTLSTLSELQKKMEVLKSRLMEERSQRQAVAHRLNNVHSEHEKELQKKQKLWESKVRELQKEKYALSMRLQKLETESPRQRLAQGGDVHLTEDDLKRLRQEIEEQESLIRGYQVENERAVERLKEIQRDGKEKERILQEQNAGLAAQLASLQASGGLKLSNEEAYASLTESLTLSAEILSAQAREAALLADIDKMKSERKDIQSKTKEFEEMMSEKKMLENKIVELEKVVGDQKSQSCKSSDAACQCVMLPDYCSDGLMSDVCELSVGPENFFQNLVNIKDKEDYLTSTETLHNKRDDTDKTSLQSLQKKMERMKRDYDLKIRSLKQQIKTKSTPPQDAEKSNARRVKELEAQISDIRSFYTKKLKELSENADKNRPKKSERSTVSVTCKKETPPEISAVKALRISEEKVASLEESLREKIAVINHLEDKLLRGLSNCYADKLSRNSSRESYREAEVSDSSVRMVASQKTMPSLSMQAECSALQVERAQPGIIEDVSSSKECKPALLADYKDGSEVGTQLNTLHGHKKIPTSNPGSPERQSERSKTQWKPVTSENNILKARPENTSGRPYPCNVSMDSMPHEQLQALQRKVREIEARHAQRELEWKAALADTKRLLNLERDMAERKWQLAMEAKKTEIECFRSEVETLLETAMQIQKVQLCTS